MAIKYWIGAAASVTQVTRFTFSAYTSGETYTITINGKGVSYTATVSTEDNVVDGLIAAIEASAEPEFSEITFTNATAAGITLTANSGGVPFVATASATSGIVATTSNDSVATGPNFFDNAANWEGGVAPVAGDDLVFRDSDVSLLFALEDSTDYGDITIDASYTGQIGLPAQAPAGYREYRPRFLKLGSATTYALTVGQGAGGNASLINLDANGNNVATVVYNTGQSADGGFAFNLKNTGSGSTLVVFRGSVSVDADTSGVLASASVTPQGDSTVSIAENVAAGAVVINGGQLELYGSATSLSASNNADVVVSAASAIPTVTVATGANILWQSSGGISGRLTAFNQGAIDFSASAAAKTIANATIHGGGTILDPLAVVTWTNGIDLEGAVIEEVVLNLGRDRNLQVAAIA